MGDDKDLLLLLMRHLTLSYRLVNAPAVSQDTKKGSRGCFAPDNLQSALTVSLGAPVRPENMQTTLRVFVNYTRLAYLLSADFLSEGFLALIRIKTQTLDHTPI